jgi:hypothetical protein
MNERNKFPGLSEFYVNTSLYTSFEISNEMKDDVYNLVYTMQSIDCYCLDCKSNSVFTPIDNRPNFNMIHSFRTTVTKGDDWTVDLENENHYFERHFLCSRVNNHRMSFYFLIRNSKLQKIGQYPSLADINSFEIYEYKKVLGEEYFKEFNKAIGLYAHGIGVGSFVYLRRIIEKFIIHPAHNLAKDSLEWDEDNYQNSRLRKKIELLGGHLPGYFVENSILYSILSKGIHELTEDECKEYFPIVRSCLELVITEMEEKRKTDVKKKEVSSKLNQIMGKIK